MRARSRPAIGQSASLHRTLLVRSNSASTAPANNGSDAWRDFKPLCWKLSIGGLSFCGLGYNLKLGDT
ncbi:hypothetical protein PsYK624_051290 [Phanerochaete sordida]|uniref:Uncharacterized protein n=1 Tax=Phanerochaete sordida TaxID=48140 RepID=A0A9P3G734_9APHY|nr:hypothetical protein PsYK624_051290 [Phanerochaete sordida]